MTQSSTAAKAGRIPRSRLARIAPVLAMALVTLIPNTPAASAEGAAVSTSAVFNNPNGTVAQQRAIKDHIIRVIDRTGTGGTGPGRTIRAALYVLDDQEYTDALVAAHRRGVNVRVVLDASRTSKPAAASLIAALTTNKANRSWVHVCTRGAACIAPDEGRGHINHNKFFTFSRVGEQEGAGEDAVIQTSANQTELNVSSYWNNAYTVVGNTGLYSAYVGYFNDLVAMVKDDNYFTSGKVGTEKYYFFPQNTGDLMADVLNNVNCTYSVGSVTRKSTVRLAVSAFANRPKIVSTLKTLAANGCTVQIIHGQSSYWDTFSGVKNITQRRLSDSDHSRVHSKYVLIQGSYAGHSDTKWTFTGSHNLNNSSLRDDDEAVLRLEGATPHDAYRQNFAEMWAVAAQP